MRLGRRAAELQWRSASGVAEVLMTKEVCALVFDHHASYRHKELFPNHLVPVDIVKLYTERLRAQSGAAEKVTTTRHLSPPVDCHHLLPITTCHLTTLFTCHHLRSHATTCHLITLFTHHDTTTPRLHAITNSRTHELHDTTTPRHHR